MFLQAPRRLYVAGILFAICSSAWSDGVTESFDKGFTDGSELRENDSWFYEEQNEGPITSNDAGLNNGWGLPGRNGPDLSPILSPMD